MVAPSFKGGKNLNGGELNHVLPRYLLTFVKGVLELYCRYSFFVPNLLPTKIMCDFS